MIIEETIIDLNKEYKGYNYSGNLFTAKDFQYFDNDAFNGCIANKLIFKKFNDDRPITLREFTFRNFVGIKELNYNRRMRIYEHDYKRYDFIEFHNLPNLEKINFPQLNLLVHNDSFIFNNLPKLEIIKVRLINGYGLGNNSYNPFGVNLSSLKDIYTELIGYTLTDWEKNNLWPFVSNVSSNAVLHFLSRTSNLEDKMRTIIRKFKYYYWFKSIVFEKPEY